MSNLTYLSLTISTNTVNLNKQDLPLNFTQLA